MVMVWVPLMTLSFISSRTTLIFRRLSERLSGQDSRMILSPLCIALNTLSSFLRFRPLAYTLTESCINSQSSFRRSPITYRPQSALLQSIPLSQSPCSDNSHCLTDWALLNTESFKITAFLLFSSPDSFFLSHDIHRNIRSTIIGNFLMALFFGPVMY